jgi:hypothetical protein
MGADSLHRIPKKEKASLSKRKLFVKKSGGRNSTPVAAAKGEGKERR